MTRISMSAQPQSGQLRSPDSISLHLPNAEATYQVGMQLGKTLEPGTVLLLQGDLGTGKTSLVQGLGAGLGITEAIDSPTFTLINEYLDGRVPLYHLDLYRLHGAEVADLYLETYWNGMEVEPGIVAIEWAERLTDRPTDYLLAELAHQADGGRSLTLHTVGSILLPPLNWPVPHPSASIRQSGVQ